MRATTIIATPFGNLLLVANDRALIECLWTNENISEKNNHPLLITASKQLQEYFNLERKIFDLQLMPTGTPFQKKVWEALLTIPYGKTCSYHDIAKQITQEKASRAVGSANAKNPLCIFIPCHRVINASGKLGGYSGGIAHKIELLELEKRN
jgi:methylated-DNA-[protein]-cysteine S-methyltransferase